MKILIVGAGLAGSCLAHHLLKEKVDVKLIDSGENHSSRMAAGMINPMVFRRMLKSWMADELIPYLTQFYREMEEEIQTSFFHERKIKRVFSSEEEANIWDERKNDAAYNAFLLDKVEVENESDHVISRYGSAYVTSPGYIDSPTFVTANQRYFKAKNILETTTFDYSLVDASSGTYANEQFDYIVFAEGYKGKENPFFGYLPLDQTKGEVITLKSATLPMDEILNRKCFVLPTVSGTFKVGATFAWHTSDLSTTEAAKTELLNHYENLTTAPYTIVDQEAGIRPTVIDRRPLIGTHPEHKKLIIFNGLGAKGYMLAPYFSKHIVGYLLHHQSILDEVNIKRFEKKYYL